MVWKPKETLQRKEKQLKKAPGVGLADVEAAKKDLKQFGFLAWLEHLQLRETIINLRSFRIDDFESRHSIFKYWTWYEPC